MNPEPRKTGTYELPRGSVVGKYEIMRRLAVGGMAEIYLARITGAAGFEKLVVLKRILPNVAEDPTFVSMFLDEARLAATLRHSNIADVYDVGEADGTYFFTMEYVHGQDVRVIRHDARKRGERVPLAVALAIVHGAASALDYAHEKRGPDGKPLDLVHRDVSASNIMVSYDGAVKLLDFGIARAASSSHKTQTGTLKGKVPYMSPEQCKGHPLDRRSDLFSLGVVLYELTVGRRPFRGDSDFAIMDQIVYKGAQPPSEAVPGYPPELEAIVMKLLERSPTLRYPSGEDLLHDVDEFVGKHGLWMSPRAIGKYMRTLFAEQIAAWEAAEQQGVPFATHVAHTITSQSQRSELLTPPSEFPGLPARSLSQEMLAVPRTTSEELGAAAPRRTSHEMPAAHLGLEQLAFGPSRTMTSDPDSQPSISVQPALRPRSSRTILLAFAGALVLGVGGVIGFVVSKSDPPPASPASSGGTRIKTMELKPATAALPQPTRVLTEDEETAATGSEGPAATEGEKPAATEGEETATIEKKPAASEKAAARIEKPAGSDEGLEAATSAPSDPGSAAAKPATATKKPARARPAAKPRPVKIKTPPKPKPDKEPTTWDPNSPFLPH